jgi:hypothetical protein
MDLRSALITLANAYDTLLETLGDLRIAAAFVEEAAPQERERAHLAPLAAQVPDKLLAVVEALDNAIPGELRAAMAAAQEWAGE